MHLFFIFIIIFAWGLFLSLNGHDVIKEASDAKFCVERLYFPCDLAYFYFRQDRSYYYALTQVHLVIILSILQYYFISRTWLYKLHFISRLRAICLVWIIASLSSQLYHRNLRIFIFWYFLFQVSGIGIKVDTTQCVYI